MRHAQPRPASQRALLQTPRSMTTSTSGSVTDDSAALVAAMILVVPGGAGSKARTCSRGPGVRREPHCRATRPPGGAVSGGAGRGAARWAATARPASSREAGAPRLLVQLELAVDGDEGERGARLPLLGQARSGEVGRGRARLGELRRAQARSGEIGRGQASSGELRRAQARSGRACNSSANSSMSLSPPTKMSTAPPRSPPPPPPSASAARCAARRATHTASSSCAVTTVAAMLSVDSSRGELAMASHRSPSLVVKAESPRRRFPQATASLRARAALWGASSGMSLQMVQGGRWGAVSSDRVEGTFTQLPRRSAARRSRSGSPASSATPSRKETCWSQREHRQCCGGCRGGCRGHGQLPRCSAGALARAGAAACAFRRPPGGRRGAVLNQGADSAVQPERRPRRDSAAPRRAAAG